MRCLFLLFLLVGCGDSEESRTYVLNGEEKKCSVIDQTPCGLTLACEDGGGIYECVGN